MDGMDHPRKETHQNGSVSDNNNTVRVKAHRRLLPWRMNIHQTGFHVTNRKREPKNPQKNAMTLPPVVFYKHIAPIDGCAR